MRKGAKEESVEICVELKYLIMVDVRIFGVVSRMWYIGAERMLDFGEGRWPKWRGFESVREVAKRRSDANKMAMLIDFAGGYDDDIQFLIDRGIKVS